MRQGALIPFSQIFGCYALVDFDTSSRRTQNKGQVYPTLILNLIVNSVVEFTCAILILLCSDIKCKLTFLHFRLCNSTKFYNATHSVALY